MPKDYKHLATKVIHAGEPQSGMQGAVCVPIFQSSTFKYEGQTSYHDLKYIRLNNTPNHMALHEKLAALEGAESAVVTSSGMAAISTTLLSFLKAGDHMLSQDCLYGGTHDLLSKDLADLGIGHDFVDAARPDTWEALLKPGTRLFYVEAITNPLMQVMDLDLVVEFSKKHGLISIIDNTFATPVNFRPAENGFDLSLHSCTKYLNGHSDIVAGAVIGNKELITRVTHKLNHLGGSLDPHACFLLHRGLKTLLVRMEYQNRSALKVARFLEDHPKVEKVNYPGLESSSGHEAAARLLNGFSGMLSFEVKGGVVMADRFMENAAIPFCAPSLGGVESLITRPATTSHAGMSRRERAASGISEELIRLSIGLEDPDDLIQDFDQAFDA